MIETPTNRTDERELCKLAFMAATAASRIRHGRGVPDSHVLVSRLADAIDGLRDHVDADWDAPRWVCSFVRDVTVSVPTTVEALKDELFDLSLKVRKADTAPAFEDVLQVGLSLHDRLMDRLDRRH